jgi:ankyrin repeat protein
LWAVEKGQEEIVKLLLSTKKVDVDWPDANGQTPLSWAAEKGHEEIVRLVLKTGAVRINSNDQFGWTPLSRAARNGHEGVVKLLLETHKCCHDLKLKDEHTPL